VEVPKLILLSKLGPAVLRPINVFFQVKAPDSVQKPGEAALPLDGANIKFEILLIISTESIPNHIAVLAVVDIFSLRKVYEQGLHVLHLA